MGKNTSTLVLQNEYLEKVGIASKYDGTETFYYNKNTGTIQSFYFRFFVKFVSLSVMIPPKIPITAPAMHPAVKSVGRYTNTPIVCTMTDANII